MEERIDPNSENNAVQGADLNAEQTINADPEVNGGSEVNAVSAENGENVGTADGDSRTAITVCAALSIAFAPFSCMVIALDVAALGFAFAGWITCIIAFAGSGCGKRVLPWIAVLCNSFSAAFLTMMFFGLDRNMGSKFTDALPLLIGDLVVPVGIITAAFIVKSVRARSFSAYGTVLLSLLCAGIVLLSVMLFNAQRRIGYLHVDPGTRITCRECGMAFENDGYQAGSPGYLEKDGRKVEVLLYIDDRSGRATIVFEDEDGFVSSSISGEVSFSEGGTVMTMTDVLYSGKELKLEFGTLTFDVDRPE